MMDYYEELGVEPSASPDEIRQAYKHLARLLHPDHCGDQQGRRLADLQMKRLNCMLQVLTNPLDRESYDRSLFSGTPALSGPPGSLDWKAPPWLWPALGVVLLAGILSLMIRTPRSAATAARSPEAAVEPAASAPQPKVPRAHAYQRPAKDSAGDDSELEGLPADQAPVQARGPAGGRSVPEPVSEEPAPVRGMPPPIASPLTALGQTPASPSMAGNWLFVPAPATKCAGLYPPEYIELRVIEEAGVLRGHYRARYRVSDKAISPTVAFEFEGRGSNDEARLPWTGPGGAKGEVTMRLLESGVLEVTWEANRMGAELGLISGTATLVRRLD
jgi:curved DNA-binding protein CbpA